MKTLIVLLLLPLITHAQDSPRKRLSDALFAEEANQDLPAAIAKYQALLDQYDQNKKAVGLAIFRLAEINRKQGNQQKATTLYTRLLTEFPNLQPQANTAKKQLLALGKKLPTTPNNNPDPEATELARLKKLAPNSPDTLLDPKILNNAASKGWLTVLQFLIDHKVPLNHGKDSYALDAAASQGHSTACELLLKNGLDPTQGNNPEAIIAAVSSNYPETVKVLLKYKVPLKKSQLYQNLDEEIASSITKDTSLAIVKELIKAGVGEASANENQNQATTTQQWMIEAAIKSRNEDIVDYLANEYSHLSIWPNSSSYRPLLWSIDTHNPKILSIILTTKPNLNTTYSDHQNVPQGIGGRTALEYSIHKKQWDMTHLLIEAGAQISPEALTSAASTGNLPIVATLLKHKADPNALDQEKLSPLSAALRNNHLEIAELLIKNGANMEDSFASAPVKMREDWIRKTKYPTLKKLPSITLSIPVLNWHTKLLDTPSTQENLAYALYATPLPRAIFSNDYIPLQPWMLYKEGIQFRILRDKQIIPLDFNADNLPPLKAGDIIEITGFKDSKPNPNSRNPSARFRVAQVNLRDSDTIQNSQPSPLIRSIKDHIQIPIKLTTPNSTRKLTLNGSLVIWDPRTDQVPLGSLREVLELLGVADALKIEKIDIQRENNFSITPNHEQARHFQLKPNDEIIIANEIYDTRFLTPIWITTSNRDFYIPIVSNVEPTLFQALTHPNDGFKAGRDSDPFSSSHLPTFEEIEKNPEVLASQLKIKGSQKTILPNIDLSNIKLIKHNKKPITINLASTIEQWDGTRTSAQKADINLESGDIIEVTLIPGDIRTRSEKQINFMKAALTFNVSILTSKGELTTKSTVYTPPTWFKTSAGLIPLQPNSTYSSLRGDISTYSYGTYILQRDNKKIREIWGTNYWPRNGDQLNLKKR